MQNKEVCTLWGKSKMGKMNNNFATFGHQKVKIFTTLFTFMGLDLANLCDSFARFGSTQHEKKGKYTNRTFLALQRLLTFLKKDGSKSISRTLFCVGFAKRNRNVRFKGTAFLASWEIAFVFIF